MEKEDTITSFAGLFFIILGAKNTIQFFHIMGDWVSGTTNTVSDFVAWWTLGTYVFDFIFIIIGCIILVYKPKKPKT